MIELPHVIELSEGFIKRLFIKNYAVFADLENEEALWDNLEAFDVYPAWVEKTGYELEGNEPFGFLFLHVAKWKKDAAAAALENYYKRMAWEHGEKYTDLCHEIMGEIKEHMNGLLPEPPKGSKKGD